MENCNRDNFSANTKEILAKRVGYKCSNPRCRKSTVGPMKNGNGIVSIGVASHICAAAPGGKRYNPNMTTDERASVDNGIWMCQNCSKLIDSDEEYYTVKLLHRWKVDAEKGQNEEISKSNSEDYDRESDKKILKWIYRKTAIIHNACRKTDPVLEYCNDGSAKLVIQSRIKNSLNINSAISELFKTKQEMCEKILVERLAIPEDVLFFINALIQTIPDKLATCSFSYENMYRILTYDEIKKICQACILLESLCQSYLD